jgi:hypothetical protein
MIRTTPHSGHRRLAVPLAAAVLAVLAACSSGGAHATAHATTSGTTSSGGSDQQRGLEIGRQYSQCARAHGQPNFPDPELNNGKLDFRGPANDQGNLKNAASAVQGACAAILNQLPASMRNSQQAVTADDLRHELQFAQCMRQHGMPEWPDPKSDGSFPIVGTPLEAEGKSQRFMTAAAACKQYWDKGISGS